MKQVSHPNQYSLPDYVYYKKIEHFPEDEQLSVKPSKSLVQLDYTEGHTKVYWGFSSSTPSLTPHPLWTPSFIMIDYDSSNISEQVNYGLRPIVAFLQPRGKKQVLPMEILMIIHCELKKMVLAEAKKRKVDYVKENQLRMIREIMGENENDNDYYY